MSYSIAVTLLAATLSCPAHGLDNGLGLKPPMGYNSWNDLNCGDSMNESSIRSVASTMVSSGLLHVGYEYLNLDDCWMDAERDKAGRLQGDLKRFPSGMKKLADYIHSKGLKFGIYSDRGSKTCQGRPASLGNEALDAQTFAQWGVDYLKEDNCYPSTGPNDKDRLFKEFGTMRDALNATGRPIFFSACGGGGNNAWNNITYYATDPRGGGKLANSWRISADVIEWSSFENAFNADNGLDRFAGAGGFNDPDMLLGSAADYIMSPERSRTQFNILAILMAPLLIGADLRNLSPHDLTTYSNAEVISVNQDSLLKQGRCVVNTTISAPGAWPKLSVSVWARELSHSKLAMVFVNSYNSTRKVGCNDACWAKLPYKAGLQFDVRDLWSGKSEFIGRAVAGEDYEVTVEKGGGASTMLLLTPVAPVILLV